MGMGPSLPAPSELSREDRDGVLAGLPPSLPAMCEQLKAAKSVVVLTGAGISVSAGIPDFRSAATGIFSTKHGLAAKYGLTQPEDLFRIERFRESAAPFYELARELLSTEHQPTVFHAFLRLLQDKGILLRAYTQNVDTLERAAGIAEEKLIEAHGSFASATCLTCGAKYDKAWLRAKLGIVPKAAAGTGPMGTASAAASSAAGGAGGGGAAVSAGAASGAGAAAVGGAGAVAAPDADAEPEAAPVVIPMCDAPGCGDGIPDEPPADAAPAPPAASDYDDGSDDDRTDYPQFRPKPFPKRLVKSDIVFYGEDLPERYTASVKPDTAAADFFIVAGSSLKVMPVCGMPTRVSPLCPRLLINRDAVNDEVPPPALPSPSNHKFRFWLQDNYRDVFLQGDADAGAIALATGCGWLDELAEVYGGLTGRDMPEVAVPAFVPHAPAEYGGPPEGDPAARRPDPEAARLAAEAAAAKEAAFVKARADVDAAARTPHANPMRSEP